MCLILVAEKGRPKPKYIESAERSNSDGIGIAWRQDGYLQYEKGLTVEETIKRSEELPLGYVIHFRMASAGGKSKNLMHPFPIRMDVPLKQKGKANKLLFHNGHWGDWQTVLMNHLSCKIPLPDGDFSDTRALALLVAIHGKSFLSLLGGYHKFVIMTPNKTTLMGSGWEAEDGVSYSNGCYKYSSTYHQSRSTHHSHGHSESSQQFLTGD